MVFNQLSLFKSQFFRALKLIITLAHFSVFSEVPKPRLEFHLSTLLKELRVLCSLLRCLIFKVLNAFASEVLSYFSTVCAVCQALFSRNVIFSKFLCLESFSSLTHLFRFVKHYFCFLSEISAESRIFSFCYLRFSPSFPTALLSYPIFLLLSTFFSKYFFTFLPPICITWAMEKKRCHNGFVLFY